MALSKVTCFKCGENTEFDRKLGFRVECGQCGEDLHCCKNCRFYDTSAYNECRETSADVVREKERANFCDFFEAKEGSGKASNQTEGLKNAAEALFKKK